MKDRPLALPPTTDYGCRSSVHQHGLNVNNIEEIQPNMFEQDQTPI